MEPCRQRGEVSTALCEAPRPPPPPRGLGPTRRRFGRRSIARGQKRNNREQKKPKQDKPKAAAAQSALAALHERPALPTPAKRK